MTYSSDALAKLVASNKEAVAEWERGADLPRLRQLANEMRPRDNDHIANAARSVISAKISQIRDELTLIYTNSDSSTIHVKVSKPLVDGMPRLRAMYRRSRWPRMTEVKTEYRRRRRQRKS